RPARGSSRERSRDIDGAHVDAPGLEARRDAVSPGFELGARLGRLRRARGPRERDDGDVDPASRGLNHDRGPRERARTELESHRRATAVSGPRHLAHEAGHEIFKRGRNLGGPAGRPRWKLWRNPRRWEIERHGHGNVRLRRSELSGMPRGRVERQRRLVACDMATRGCAGRRAREAWRRTRRRTWHRTWRAASADLPGRTREACREPNQPDGGFALGRARLTCPGPHKGPATDRHGKSGARRLRTGPTRRARQYRRGGRRGKRRDRWLRERRK